jgi:O-antigen ligase
MKLDRVHLAALADHLAAAAAISLPWSTSATSILVPLWAAAAFATLDGAALRRMALTPAATLPVALVALAVAGALWSEAGWPERLSGLTPFIKLLMIPLALAQFSRSGRGETVLAAFFASACALLAVSWTLGLVPQILWPVSAPGVPVKDYIFQSGEFTLCGFAALDRAIASWRRSPVAAALLAGLALLFLGNIVFVALGRTSIVVIGVLFALLGLRHFERRALAAFVAAGVAIAAVAWTASPYLRSRVTHLAAELDGSVTDLDVNSAGLRLGFWKMSLIAIGEAPLLGHGAGATETVFARIAASDRAAPRGATNPHNQIFATAIPLGLAGAALLLAMWTAHAGIFAGRGPVAWIGLSIVTQSFVGSLFNSHLSDFSHGWLYVIGVGAAGGMMLRNPHSEGGQGGRGAAISLRRSFLRRTHHSADDPARRFERCNRMETCGGHGETPAVP